MKDKNTADDEFLAAARRAFKRVARQLRSENRRLKLPLIFGNRRSRSFDFSERGQSDENFAPGWTEIVTKNGKPISVICPSL